MRVLFWSYERGTWQYDVAVILILVFSLLTPRRGSRTSRRSGLPANSDQVKLISQRRAATEIYQVDSRTMAPPERTPALQNDLHTVLQKALPELADGHFAIGRIEPQRDEKGNVVAYQVEIRH